MCSRARVRRVETAMGLPDAAEGARAAHRLQHAPNRLPRTASHPDRGGEKEEIKKGLAGWLAGWTRCDVVWW